MAIAGKRRFVRNNEVRRELLSRHGPPTFERIPGTGKGSPVARPEGWISANCIKGDHKHCYSLKCACSHHAPPTAAPPQQRESEES